MTISLKNYKVFPTTYFMKQAKKLAKKYPLIKNDFANLAKQLKKDPTTGQDSLGKDCYKIRMPINGKSSGQSGAARVIIEVKVIDKRVYILSVYDKSDKEAIFDDELKEALKDRLKEYPDFCK